jgi:hypothetical protein
MVMHSTPMEEHEEPERMNTMKIPKSQTEQVQWLRKHCAPLQRANPGVPLGDIVALLPEPDRSIAHDIVFATVSLDDLPIERHQRQPWHDAVEDALVTITNAETQQRFSTNYVLKVACLDPESPEYDDAFIYAEGLLTEACGRSIRQPPQMVA